LAAKGHKGRRELTSERPVGTARKRPPDYKATDYELRGPVVPSSVVLWSGSGPAWWSQSRGQYDTDSRRARVSEKHERQFWSDFLFLRNTGGGGEQKSKEEGGQKAEGMSDQRPDTGRTKNPAATLATDDTR